MHSPKPSLDTDWRSVFRRHASRSPKTTATIQPALSSFTQVCSYDLANFGDSDKAPVKLQSVDEVVDDLHGWLEASDEKGPFILVGHSNSGIYARSFATRYPREAAGLVFVDSTHEEQALRLHQLNPQGFKRLYRARSNWALAHVQHVRSFRQLAKGRFSLPAAWSQSSPRPLP